MRRRKLAILIACSLAIVLVGGVAVLRGPSLPDLSVLDEAKVYRASIEMDPYGWNSTRLVRASFVVQRPIDQVMQKVRTDWPDAKWFHNTLSGGVSAYNTQYRDASVAIMSDGKETYLHIERPRRVIPFTNISLDRFEHRVASATPYKPTP